MTSDQQTHITTNRSVTIKANDKTTVLGTRTLMAGRIQQLAEGDISTGTCANLLEKIGGIRKSVTTIKQQLIAPQCWVGSADLNVLQCLMGTLDVLQQLASQTAEHVHPSNGSPPSNSADIAATGAAAGKVKARYNPAIE
ncbi:hypothetical protein [Serratia fonticola]|uniref:Uncharacterized protein n=1 Tax=Serratia fonticola TaxID=47917 RepID=A0AAW3WNN5_SERFO|nr:hypothetical protein [Serratia fonticola]MBC3211187.1 hypothetical protein [Serratia fonticola]NYA12169.1 hypothetical protein [Serratia fonticola]NYA31748.1 hypothetical protein [Serratia fonticola]